MNVFKNQTPATKKTVTLANDNVEKYRHLDGKTLVDIDNDATFGLIDVRKGVNNHAQYGKIISLLLETGSEKIAFPISNSLDEDFLASEDLPFCRFYVRRKRAKDADGNLKDGEDLTPSGVEYISFGKPGGLTFEEETSLVGVVPAEEIK